MAHSEQRRRALTSWSADPHRFITFVSDHVAHYNQSAPMRAGPVDEPVIVIVEDDPNIADLVELYLDETATGPSRPQPENGRST